MEETANSGDSTTKRTHRRERLPKRYPLVFISHRHRDEDLIRALVALLETAFDINKEDVRCTSVHPYKLDPGVGVSERLRAEIQRAKVVIGLLTPDTAESRYVLFELGAAWGQKLRFFPLLAKGATPADLPNPVSDRHPLKLTVESDCHQLLKSLRDIPGLRARDNSEERTREKVRDLVREAETTNRFGLRITKPKKMDAISGRDFSVEGTFTRLPTGGTFRVFITNFEGTKIWPQKRVLFDHETKTWQAKASLLEQPENEGYIVVAEVGETGKLLSDYYTEIGEAKDVWIPLSSFTPDTILYDQVYVQNSYKLNRAASTGL